MTAFYSSFYPTEGTVGAKGSAAFANASVIIDLSNDTVTVPSSNDGLTTNFGSAVTTVSILEGLTNVTNLWSISAVPGTGVTGTFTSNTYTVATMSNDSGTVTFTATRSGYATLTAVFTIAKARAGTPGGSVTVYDIRASQGVIKKNAAGAFTPTTITFEGLSITGTGAPAAYSGRFIIAASTDSGATYSTVYTSLVDQPSYTYTLSGATVTHIRATLYAGGAAAGTTPILDQEVFPVASDGSNAISGYLTNETHNVSADSNGGSYSLTASGGTFKVFNGTTDVTTSSTFSVVAPATKNGLTMSIGAATGIYSLSGASWTTDSESFTLRAIQSGVTIDLVYTITKAKTGATGAQGPSLALTASAQAFTYTDNVANPVSQTITLTATLQNLTGTASWTTTPSVTLGGLATATTRTLAVADFGANRQVTIEITVAGITDRITVVRLERDIFSGNANRVPFSRFEGGTGWATGGNFAPTPFLTISDARSFIIAEPTFTAANQNVYLFNSPRFPVSEGERLSASGRIQAFALSGGGNPSLWQYYIEFYSANSTNLGNQIIGTGTTSITENILHSAFATAPSGTRSAQVVLLYRSSSAGLVRMAILEPMVTSALSGQTAHPSFTPGPNAFDGATVGAVAGTNLLDSNGRALTDGDISNTSQRVAVRQWAFNNNSLNGWSGVAQIGSAPTVTAGTQFVTFTSNSTDTSFMSPDMLGVDGRVGRYLRMILSATAQLSATMRDVEIYYSTNAYAPIDGTRSNNGTWIPANHPTNGTPFEVLIDMHSWTGSAANAWRDEIVRRVRIDFDAAAPETIRIHEISMVYLGTATVGAPPGTPVGAYTDAALIQPAVVSAATTALWPSVTGTGRPADYADVTRTVLPALQRGTWSASSVAYALGDIVTRDGSSYTCIIANTSTGANGPPSANWSLLAQVGAQGTTGVSAPPTKALGTGGAAQFDPVRLTAGQTITVEAALYLNTGGIAGTCSLQVQWSVNAANSWTTMTNGSASSNLLTSEAVELIIPNATFTNTSGVAQLYDIRTTSTRQSRTVNQPPSYMRVI